MSMRRVVTPERGTELYVEAGPWLELVGVLEEPVNDVSNV
jgi:hypothetical protein